MSRHYDRDYDRGDRHRDRRDRDRDRRDRDYDRRERDYDRRDRDRDYDRRDRDKGRDRDRDHDRRSERDSERRERDRESVRDPEEDPKKEAPAGGEEQRAEKAEGGATEAPAAAEGSRRKKRFGWDVDASGSKVAEGAGTPKPAPSATPGVPQLSAMQQTAMLTAVLQQQAALTRRARRLHVGNLPAGLTGEALKELFNTTMQAAKLALDEQGCVNAVQLAGDNRFAFVEFRSVVECSSALVLNGMQLLDKALKVQRPNDFAPPPAGLDTVKIPESVSATVTSSNMPPQSAGLLGIANPLAAVGLGGGLSGITAMNPALSAVLAASCGGAGAGITAGVSGLSGASLAALSSAGGLAGAASLAAGGGAAAAQNVMAISRRCRRLHIGNLPMGVGLTAEMLKQFFNAALVSASLHDTSKEGEPVVDSMLGNESKFGFVEFRTIAEATSCLALNNIELGGKQLRVERPRDYAPMPEAMMDQLRSAGVLGNTSVAPDGKDLLSEEPPAPVPAPGDAAQWLPGMGGLLALPGAPPPSDKPGLPLLVLETSSTVLALHNMVTKEDLANAEEMTDILEDTKLECGKHGPVVAVITPMPGTSGLPGSGIEAREIEMKIFVRFGSHDAAASAAKELHGKQFDGRTVTAAFLAEPLFDALQGLPCFSG